MANRIRLGSNAVSRADDLTVIANLGGVPFNLLDGFDAQRNAIYRLELESGRPFEVARRYLKLDEFATFPTGFDTWAASRDPKMTLMLAVEPGSNVTGIRYTFYEMAFTALQDAAVDAAFDAIKSYMDTYKPPKLYIDMAHEPSGADTQLSVEARQNRNSTHTTMQIRCRAGVGLIKFLPSSTVLNFGGGNTATLTADATPNSPTYPDPTVVNCTIVGNISIGDTATIETTAEQRADYAAMYAKFRPREDARWTGWTLRNRVKWAFVLFQSEWDNISGPTSGWYPGDDFIDICGMDLYPGQGKQRGNPVTWEELSELVDAHGIRTFVTAHGKKAMIAEIGSLEGVRLFPTETKGPIGGATTLAVQALKGKETTGAEVIFYNADGTIIPGWTGVTITANANQGDTSIGLSSIPTALTPASIGAIRPVGKSKAGFTDNKLSFLKSSWSDMEAICYFFGGGTQDGNWIEQPPDGSADSMARFKVMATDPLFWTQGQDVPPPEGEGPGPIPIPTVLPPIATPIHEYVVKFADRNGTEIEEYPAKNLQYSYILNSPGAVSFVLPLRHPKAVRSTLDVLREIHVYRDGVRVWGGYCWSIQPGSSSGDIQISGEGYFSMFTRKRNITDTKVYPSTEQFAIAADLIAYTQAKINGQLGISVKPVTASGVLRDRTYNGYEQKNLGDALQELAAVDDGFDFEIDSFKQWITYYPAKGVGSGIVYELGKNILGISQVIDAIGMANSFTAVGSGVGTTTLLSVAADLPSQVAYGLLEDSAAFADVVEQPTLDSHAAEELRLAKDPTDTPQLAVLTTDPPFGAVNVGDICGVRCQLGYIDVDDDYRVTSIVIQVSDEGQEHMELFFDPVVS